MSKRVQLLLKRAVDIAAATSGLILLSPVFLIIGVAIKLDSAGPVFFRQERVGRGRTRFRIPKFRTMVDGAELVGSGVYVNTDDPRITRVGKFLRRWSLDELPQLLCVIAGEMSLVGPRPALPYQLKYYSNEASRRLLMRPGITGWSQVNGRNNISWPERLERDVWYIEHFSLVLDMYILLRTVVVSLSGEGLYGARRNFLFTGQDDLSVPLERNL